MTATAHALVGVTLAAFIPNPFIGIPAAFISHVLCDLTPHWDAGTHMKEKSRKQFAIEAVADVMISFFAALLLMFFIFPLVNPYYGLSMAFSAQLLDWLTAPYLFLKMKFKPFIWIFKFQYATNITLDKPWGIVTQAIVVLILVGLVKLV